MQVPTVQETQPKRRFVNYADYKAPTRQRKLDHKHEASTWPDISINRSSSGSGLSVRWLTRFRLVALTDSVESLCC